MLEPDAKFVPVIIGIGELCDRPSVDVEGMDAIELMFAALTIAERDAGARILDRLDWLGVEDEISFPMRAPQEALAERLPRPPAIRVKTHEASGDGPIMLINDAANLIGGGEIGLAACVGAGALRTAGRRAQADIAAEREPPRSQINDVAEAGATPLARKHRLFTPIDVYPLYENATRAAWGQTLAEAQRETGEIWSRFSEVAAANPSAWLRRTMSPEEIAEPTADNRVVSFPYTKLMVANASVNMGAAVLVASLAVARELGIAEDRLIYVGAGAAAHESDDFLKRENYGIPTSLTATITAALQRNALSADDLDHVELYSCFPCVPKMARRVLGWPADRPATVYGGLTFGGGPIGNCMMHAAAQMVVKLREAGENGLIVANGGYATHSHSLVLTRKPVPAGTFPQDYDVQALADACRGPAPALIEDYEGEGTIETYTMPFDRKGSPSHATVIARTPHGARFLAHVPCEDRETITLLMAEGREPIGSAGLAERQGDRIVWTPAKPAADKQADNNGR